MNKKEVLVVFPSPRDLRYLASPKIAERCRISLLGGYVENPMGFDPIVPLVSALAEGRPDGVAATEDHPAAFVASLLARALDLPGPTPESVLLCQHKYYSRVAQSQAVPEAVPPFDLIALHAPKAASLPYPFFLKPVKGVLSILAGKVESERALENFLEQAKGRMPSFADGFDRLIREAGLSDKYPVGGNHFIGEKILHGDQVTLEGYVFQGKVHLIDIVDSVFYPGTLSFERFQAPSNLKASVQERMFRMARRFIESIGFSDGLFNVEFIYDSEKDAVHFIEVNSRMAHQFAGMMEALHGVNPYEILIELALGREPSFERHRGRHRVAASFVLRKFEDARVERVPTEAEMEGLRPLFPFAEFEILARSGQRLSDSFRQDEESYRYAIVNLAASSEEELFESFAEAERRLLFQFSE